jgi:hypothetical protein
LSYLTCEWCLGAPGVASGLRALPKNHRGVGPHNED